jgi:hypothetical protein
MRCELSRDPGGINAGVFCVWRGLQGLPLGNRLSRYGANLVSVADRAATLHRDRVKRQSRLKESGGFRPPGVVLVRVGFGRFLDRPDWVVRVPAFGE